MVIHLGLGFMEGWDNHRMNYNSRNGQHQHRHRYHQHHSRNQSFSSALLDAICKSTEDEGEMMSYKKSSKNVEAMDSTGMRNSIYKPVVRIERQWEENPWLNNEKSMRGRSTKSGVLNAEKCKGEAAYSKQYREFHLSFQPNMSSGSSSSSDAYFKTKSQTRKDSKKPKNPTSPARKLAKFLNSLFMAGGIKKPKLSSSSVVSDSNSYDSYEKKPSSVYSSSSGHSRSCLSKTSTGSKNSSGMSQRSVDFYPTSIIVDEDSNPCGEMCLNRMEKYPPSNPNPANHPHTYPSTGAHRLPLLNKELQFHIPDEGWHAAAAAKDIIIKYQKANNIMEAVVIRGLNKQNEEEKEDDDDASCSSSELFELENLAGIDMNMSVYQKELPVYETTHLETNKAIARGLIV